jgi:hypothetical protein
MPLRLRGRALLNFGQLKAGLCRRLMTPDKAHQKAGGVATRRLPNLGD